MTDEVLQTASNGSGFAPRSSNRDHDESLINPPPVKKKRNLPGNPHLDGYEPFLCEVCGKGFQRDQNLQLHRRGHNLPWKLKQRTSKEVRKRVYVCPEQTCHFCRKHGEKRWNTTRKQYAVLSDYKAHSKTCGTREYRCDCGTIFSRRDSFITYRAFCDALAEETAKKSAASHLNGLAATARTAGTNLNYQYLMGTLNSPLQPFVPQPPTNQNHHHHFLPPPPSSSSSLSLWMGQDIAPPQPQPHDYDWDFGNARAASGCIDNNNNSDDEHITQTANAGSTTTATTLSVPSLFSSDQTQNSNENVIMSATALLQKAAEIGASSTAATNDPTAFLQRFPLKTSAQNTIYDGGERFFDLFGSNNKNGVIMSHSHDLETDNARNDDTVASAVDGSESYPWKRRRVDDGGEGGGEGGGGRPTQTMCHPSSINGWI
ncbi:hypothetical protein Bca52824_054099 [Brassica carinata]|uniref:C2H2-type domain-containing protein n=1 Tax=Brassica carinata TaxID=52824 RepID=A0A8X7RCX1_BRACI|nr:hypothetical protein Bca52824_054099 [Brassica carinata]